MSDVSNYELYKLQDLYKYRIEILFLPIPVYRFCQDWDLICFCKHRGARDWKRRRNWKGGEEKKKENWRGNKAKEAKMKRMGMVKRKLSSKWRWNDKLNRAH